MTQYQEIFNELVINKKRLFWVLNLSGWSVFLILWAILYFPKEYNFLVFIEFIKSNFILPLLLSFPLRYVYQRIKAKNYSLLRISVIILLSSLISSLIWYYLDLVITVLINNYEIKYLFVRSGLTIVRVLFSMSMLLILWSAFYFIINLFYDWQEERNSKEKAMMLALETRMEVLKNQINPHFLFNSLNTISALIEENTAKAQLLIDELSSFLRFTLKNKSNVTINLKEEINFIKHYVKIQSIRFEEKLECYFSIDTNTEELPVIPAILYPIVENAIKHGINASDLPLRVYITARVNEKNLELSIRNSGTWIKKADINNGTHTGIYNVKERLKCEYGTRAKFEIIITPGFVDVQLTIPIN